MRTPFKIVLAFIVIATGLAGYLSFTQSNGNAAASDTATSTIGKDGSVNYSGSDYPTLETFSERWNVQPKFHDTDDQQAMTISQPWTNCDGSNDQSCMNVMVCDGHGSIRALRDDTHSSYTYIFVINAGNAYDPNSSTQCPSGQQRLFNALYNDPAVAQEAIAGFMGLRKGVTSENYTETYKNDLYDMRWARLNNAFIKLASPTLGGDSSPEELRNFWAHSVEIAILSKTNTRNAQP